MGNYTSPENLPQRKSIRAKHHNYAGSATYLITICTKDKERFFEDPTLRTRPPHKSLHVVGESKLANVRGPNWLKFP
jgi:hypothetical protein